MARKPISPENLELLSTNIDELVLIMNAVIEAKGLPFAVDTIHFVELFSKVDEGDYHKKIEENEVFEENALIKPEVAAFTQPYKFREIDERFNATERNPCPHGIKGYKCDKFGNCIPICYP